MEVCQSVDIPPIFCHHLILFDKATQRQAHVMRKAVGFFCNASCQKVSFEKSRVFCSPNLHSNFAAVLATICGSSVTKNLEKFRGFPLINSRVTKATIYDLLRRSKNNFLPGKIRFFPSLVELLSYNLSRRLFLSALCKL